MNHYLIVRVSGAVEAQRIIDYMNKFSPVAYRSNDSAGMTVVVPCTNPLEYGQDLANRFGTIQAYGIKADGTKFRLKDGIPA